MTILAWVCAHCMLFSKRIVGYYFAIITILKLRMYTHLWWLSRMEVLSLKFSSSSQKYFTPFGCSAHGSWPYLGRDDKIYLSIYIIPSVYLIPAKNTEVNVLLQGSSVKTKKGNGYCFLCRHNDYHHERRDHGRFLCCTLCDKRIQFV